jgi:hypothetical protein
MALYAGVGGAGGLPVRRVVSSAPSRPPDITDRGYALGYPQPGYPPVPAITPIFTGPTASAPPSGPSVAPAAVAADPIPPSQWASQIAKDPLYVLAQQQIKAQKDASQAALRASQQQAVIRFGEVPAGLPTDERLGKALDATTAQLAKENTKAHLSTVSRLQDQYDQGYRQGVNALAARGLLHSGETGYQLGLLQRGLQQSRYGAAQQLLDYLGGQWSGYAQSEAGRQQQLVDAMNAAVSRLLSYPALAPGVSSSGTSGSSSSGSGSGSGSASPHPTALNPAVTAPVPVVAPVVAAPVKTSTHSSPHSTTVAAPVPARVKVAHSSGHTAAVDAFGRPIGTGLVP